MSELEVPALIVTGSDDVILDANLRQEVAEIGNQRVRVEVVDRAGHSVRRDRGDAYHAVVDPFIAACFGEKAVGR